MANIEKKPTLPFSRVKNHLAELQRWWPVHIKNDTNIGISVDPVLFRSNFGPVEDTATVRDEAQCAGIRVEAITDAGATPTGTANIVISGSGTFNPRCTINHGDGTSTTWLLVAPTGELLSSAEFGADMTEDEAKQVNILTGLPQTYSTLFNPPTDTTGDQFASGMCASRGPYPVFMTVQELVGLIDNSKHTTPTGNLNKPSFTPHGLSAHDSQTSRQKWVAPQYDTRISPASANMVEANAVNYRATVFMPMMLDNNQLANSSAWDSAPFNVVGLAPVICKNGIKRYDQQPNQTTGLRYKVVGTSGDHKLDYDEQGFDFPAVALEDQNSNNNRVISYSKDSTQFGSPSYRMSQALACFLKDGTYALNDGCLIPYNYDNNRYIGGQVTNTLYTTWDGTRGYGDSTANSHEGGPAAAATNYNKYKDDSPAGIYPFFDFVQGPLAPRAQGNNWSFRQTAQLQTTNDYANNRAFVYQTAAIDRYQTQAFSRGYGHNDMGPNSRPALVVSVAYDDTTQNLSVIVLRDSPVAGSRVYRMHNAIPRGIPIYIEGITGALGRPEDLSAQRSWSRGRFNTSQTITNNGAQNANGWWLPWSIVQHGDVESGMIGERTIAKTPNTLVPLMADVLFGGDNTVKNFVEYRIHIPRLGKMRGMSNVDVPAYIPIGATLKVGRNGGQEMGIGLNYMLNGSGVRIFERDERTWLDESNQVALAQNSTLSYNPMMPKEKWGLIAGMGSGDNNVPAGSSANDTMPARPTIGYAQVADNGIYAGNDPVPRSIAIQTTDSIYNFKIDSYPSTITRGGGVLRIPPPLGHDLCDRYNVISIKRGYNASNQAASTPSFLWRPNSSAASAVGVSASNWIVRADGTDSATPDKWASRGIGTPLISFMDSETGRHAWDYVKPHTISGLNVWRYGRNRPWPVHERMGTRMAATPSLGPNASLLGYSTLGAAQPIGVATTKTGLSEVGCSPIHLDMEMTAYIPAQDNRLVIMEFDLGEDIPSLGRHTLITESQFGDLGFGFKPQWNGETNASVFTFDPNSDKDGLEIAMPATTTGGTNGLNPYFSVIYDTYQSGEAVFGATPTTSGYGYSVQNIFQMQNPAAESGGSIGIPSPRAGTSSRSAIWFMGSNTHYTKTENVWLNQVTPSYTAGVAGYGRTGNAPAGGKSTSFTQGINTVRAVFTNGGMSYVLNGEEQEVDVSSQGPVWGFTLKSCSLMTFPYRKPFCLTTDNGGPFYNHLLTEEPSAFAVTNSSVTTNRFGYGMKWDFTGGVAGDQPSHTHNFPKLHPIAPTSLLNNRGKITSKGAPSLNHSMIDLQVDEMILRHIPTPAMLPFTVDTTTLVSPVEAARYTSLAIVADNIDVTNKMNVTVTLMENPTTPTSESAIAREGTVPIAGFEDLDLQFVGGYGAVDLTGLPVNYVATGFVVRFNFYIPTSDDLALMPIDWTKTPTIRSWALFFDHKPTADISIVGNTFNGTVATTIGTTGVQTGCSTKVGHILSMIATGTTTDPDRLITQVKVDFGDGTNSGWLDVATQALVATANISHVYSSMPASGTTFDITCMSRDDSNNISASSDIIRVSMTQAEPVAILRTIPSTVRAGQAIRLDGADSYNIDTSASISSYTWTFGDGSIGVTTFTKYADHTYATAGEYMTTLVVTDNGGTVSPAGKAVVKILPATLIVPLTLNTKPSGFSRSRSASLSRSTVLDSIYPEVHDTGQRGDTFSMQGSFFHTTQNQDIEFMEELLLSGSLVEFDWQDVNYLGVADTKTFVGRMTSFDYNRKGGDIDHTPWTASFVREAGLDA